MGKQIFKRFQLVIILLLLTLFFFGGFIFAVFQYEARENERLGIKFSKDQTNTVTDTRINDERYYSYKGKDNVDALTVLKYEATVTQNSSGLVIVINGNKADDSKREYWSFYVNGKLANVGPKDYITKDTDKIEWKIEKY